MTLISVITPTWQRPIQLQDRCMRSVHRQTWHEVEHIVVSDGPDPQLAESLLPATAEYGGMLTYAELPDHNPALSAWGSRARNHGLSLAKGEFIAYLDDDNRYQPHHLAVLADALQCNMDADFAYSMMLRHPSLSRRFSDIVGGDPPAYGCIDSSLIMHRAGVPERLGMWPSPMPADSTDSHAPDWDMIRRWLEGGARWVFAPQITVDYYFTEDD